MKRSGHTAAALFLSNQHGLMPTHIYEKESVLADGWQLIANNYRLAWGE
jgi:hypothetical protein